MEKLLVPLGLFILIAGGAFAWDLATATTVHHNADDLAHQWIQEVFPPEEARTARVSCQSTDSDGNGYVSCTLNITREGEEQLVPIECHAYVMINLGDTCRPLVPFGIGRR
jgi:hypothetical protein